MQFAIPAKGRMTPRAINGNAQKLRIELLELGQHFVVKAHLVAADRAPISRIKGEHHRSPTELGQFHGLIRGALEGEIRRGRAGAQSTGSVAAQLRPRRTLFRCIIHSLPWIGWARGLRRTKATARSAIMFT